jgi:hypothetical protein
VPLRPTGFRPPWRAARSRAISARPTRPSRHCRKGGASSAAASATPSSRCWHWRALVSAPKILLIDEPSVGLAALLDLTLGFFSARGGGLDALQDLKNLKNLTNLTLIAGYT